MEAVAVVVVDIVVVVVVELYPLSPGICPPVPSQLLSERLLNFQFKK